MSVHDPEFERRLVEATSRGLPLVSRPYAAIAKQIGSTEARVIEGIQRIMQRGDIKALWGGGAPPQTRLSGEWHGGLGYPG